MSNKSNMQQREKAWDGCMSPDEKGTHYGLDFLSDSVLIGLVIRIVTRDRKALEVSSELLAIGGRQLMNLHMLSLTDMVSIEGIGKVKALQLKAVAELSKRLSEARLRREITLETPASIANYYMERMRHETQEHLYVSLFDGKGQFVEDTLISKGTSSYAVLSPKEIYSYALRRMASFIVILHNHPSGLPEPSKNDDKATRRILQCGELLDIPLLDHIIIGDKTYYSYREAGMLD